MRVIWWRSSGTTRVTNPSRTSLGSRGSSMASGRFDLLLESVTSLLMCTSHVISDWSLVGFCVHCPTRYRTSFESMGNKGFGCRAVSSTHSCGDRSSSCGGGSGVWHCRSAKALRRVCSCPTNSWFSPSFSYTWRYSREISSFCVDVCIDNALT
ncbi:hypothetical protein H257_01592 [Aphanomyces astaci]|uniref:Uncharacterized protein n=1 Tax=Aphanomyces astaci TaxID=112090 RepID=W4HB25_APHAT|nr:hypothetical protein H257_01592 [Aphanomyces astaci]ETV88318.1 hypothetical protein H257_01592 [Aphanomyces astaci]|eukprot:XP_009823181.1 hypothetical protein H257_01592 [Aphanomyces astaci]